MKLPSGESVPLNHENFIPEGSTIGRYKDARHLPPGAVRIPDGVVVRRFYALVDKWKPWHEMWSFKFSPFIMGGLTAASGIISNTVVRRRLALISKGSLVTSLPLLVTPVVASLVFHQHIASKILLRQYDCTVCAQVRATAGQVSVGLVIPVLMSYLGSVAMARLHATVWIPPFRDARASWKFFVDTMRPSATGLAVLLCLNIFITCGLMVAQSLEAPQLWEAYKIELAESRPPPVVKSEETWNTPLVLSQNEAAWR